MFSDFFFKREESWNWDILKVSKGKKVNLENNKATLFVTMREDQNHKY